MEIIEQERRLIYIGAAGENVNLLQISLNMTDHVTEHVVMGYKLSSYSDTLVFGIICQRVEYKCEIDFLNLFDMIHIGVIFTDVHVLYLLTIY